MNARQPFNTDAIVALHSPAAVNRAWDRLIDDLRRQNGYGDIATLTGPPR